MRITGLFMAMPVIGTRVVPARARIALAVMVTVVAAPMLPEFDPVPLLSLTTAVVVAKEILIGALVGFTFQIVFQSVVLAGQLMAMKIGLGFASMNDPANGVQTTIISQFNLMIMTLVFIAVNGHLMLIELIIHSFETMPLGAATFSIRSTMHVVELGSWLFATAVVMSLPVLTALLVINICFGVMSRAAPQLNIFAVGFPFTLVCGLVLIWLGLSSFSPYFERVMDHGFITVKNLLDIT